LKTFRSLHVLALITCVLSMDCTQQQRTINIQGITLVSIPAGSFRMGTEAKDDKWFEHSRPVHTVSLDAFKISSTEITQAQYLRIIGTNPSAFAGNDNHPVEQVSWYEAVTFCNKLSEKAGLEPCYDLNSWECDFTRNGFRLPTEAEWEYACRAGATTEYCSGDSISDLEKVGWYGLNSDSTTHPAGSKKPNAFGLYDMHGNVWEWCNDWWQHYYNDNSERNPAGPESGFSRVLRGGGWGHHEFGCRSAYRSGYQPDFESDLLGFRVVCR